MKNNIAFCIDILRNDRFQSGDFSTKFLEEEYPKGFKGSILEENELNELASVVYLMDFVKKDHDGEPSPLDYNYDDDENEDDESVKEEKNPYLLHGESFVNLTGVTGNQ